MNRKQAENVLDAYVRMRMRESDKEASDSLRDVILDAMTDIRVYPITVPQTQQRWDNPIVKPLATFSLTCADGGRR